jgi:hypothetical protein
VFELKSPMPTPRRNSEVVVADVPACDDRPGTRIDRSRGVADADFGQRLTADRGDADRDVLDILLAPLRGDDDFADPVVGGGRAVGTLRKGRGRRERQQRDRKHCKSAFHRRPLLNIRIFSGFVIENPSICQENLKFGLQFQKFC